MPLFPGTLFLGMTRVLPGELVLLSTVHIFLICSPGACSSPFAGMTAGAPRAQSEAQSFMLCSYQSAGGLDELPEDVDPHIPC